MRTLEVEFGERAHVSVTSEFDHSEERWQVEEVALRNGGSVRDVEGTVQITDQLPKVPATNGDRIELRVLGEDGAEVEYIHPNKRPDVPPSIVKLNRPGANYPVLGEDPTGGRHVVSKAFVVVR